MTDQAAAELAKQLAAMAAILQRIEAQLKDISVALRMPRPR